MSTLHDWPHRPGFSPAPADQGSIVHCRNVLELMFTPTAQPSCATFQAPSRDEARLIAEYSFFMSANAVVARW